jgi:putative peptidoglycan lipid II flippase
MSKDRELLRASSIVAVGTLVSRITGLARSLMTVALLGSGLLGDTYGVANQMPNILYNLIIGGSLTAVFVPQIVRALADKEGGKKYLSSLLTFTTVFMGVLTLITIAIAPFLVDIFSASFIGRPEFKITVLFMRLCLPQIFFLTLYVLLGQIANAQGKFLAMAWAPVFNNLTLIFGFGLFIKNAHNLSIGDITNHQIFLIGAVTTLSYIVQTAILLPVIIKNRLTPRFLLGSQRSELTKSMRLASWTLIFAGISQVSFLVVQNLATHAAVKALAKGIQTGVGITPYNNAYLIFILPQSVFVLSLTTTLLPHISRLIHEKIISQVQNAVEVVLDRAALMVVPSTVFLLIFGVPIAQLLFAHLTHNSSKFIGEVLMGFALGLPAYSYYTLGLRVLNAFENVKLQVKGNLIMNLFAISLSVLVGFLFPVQFVTIGLAVVLSISYYFGMFYTLNQIRKFSIEIPVKNIIRFNYRALMISLFSALPAYFFYYLVEKLMPGNAVFAHFLQLGVAGLVFLASYLYWGNLIRLGEIPRFTVVLRERFSQKR